jgi:hypothetical protein
MLDLDIDTSQKYLGTAGSFRGAFFSRTVEDLVKIINFFHRGTCAVGSNFLKIRRDKPLGTLGTRITNKQTNKQTDKHLRVKP